MRVIVPVLVMAVVAYATIPLWDRARACQIAQEAVSVGAAEADLRARLGEPYAIYHAGYEGTLFGARRISGHALMYRVERWWFGNWVIVYVDEDGLVECVWATTTGSE